MADNNKISPSFNKNDAPISWLHCKDRNNLIIR